MNFDYRLYNDHHRDPSRDESAYASIRYHVLSCLYGKKIRQVEDKENTSLYVF